MATIKYLLKCFSLDQSGEPSNQPTYIAIPTAPLIEWLKTTALKICLKIP